MQDPSQLSDEELFRIAGVQPQAAPQQRAPRQAAPARPAPAPLSGVRGQIESLLPGVNITSGRRSPERNKAVGGAPNSFHLRGQAFDLTPPQGVSMAELERQLRASGLPFAELINEGDHIHVAWEGDADDTPTTPQPRQPGSPRAVVDMSDAELMALAEGQGISVKAGAGMPPEWFIANGLPLDATTEDMLSAGFVPDPDKPGYWMRGDPRSEGHVRALDQERGIQAEMQAEGVGSYADPGFTDQFTAPINDELGFAAGYVSQGLGNIGRRLTGQDVEVSALDRARAMRDLSREGQETFEQERPVSALAGGVLGGAAFGPARGAALPGLLGRLGQAGGVGAAYGAAEGDGALGRGKSAAVAGLLSTAAAGALEGAGPLVQRTRSGISEAGARVQRGVGIEPRAAAITPRTTDRALEYVRRVADNAGADLADNPLAALGKPITAAEAIGPNGVSQMVALTRRSGRTGALAEAQLGARAADQPNRVLQDFADLTGADPSGSADVIANLASAGRARAAPLYDAAYARPGAVRSPLIDDLMGRPSSQKAFRRAVAIAREEGRDPTTMGFQFDEAGDVIHVREPSMQTMDYIKRGMDDGLNAYRDSTTRRLNLDERGRAELRTLTAFRNELERLNPAYKEALSAGGDPIRLEEAFGQAGRLFGTGVNERVFAQRIAGMAEADRGALVAGLADDLYSKARNGRLRPNQLDNPAFRGKLSQLIGEENAGAFITRVQAEVALARTGGRMAPNVNSTTGEALEAMRQQDQGVGFGADLARNIEQSGVVGGTLRTGASAVAAPVAGFVRGFQAPAPQGVRDEIGRLLLMSPDELNGLLAAQAASGVARRQGRITGLLSRPGAVAAGQQRARGLLTANP